MGGFGCGPEIGDGEAVFEVGAEVVHPADGEHDVHSELIWMLMFGGILDEWGDLELTLKISRVEPPMLGL